MSSSSDVIAIHEIQEPELEFGSSVEEPEKEEPEKEEPKQEEPEKEEPEKEEPEKEEPKVEYEIRWISCRYFREITPEWMKDILNSNDAELDMSSYRQAIRPCGGFCVSIGKVTIKKESGILTKLYYDDAKGEKRHIQVNMIPGDNIFLLPCVYPIDSDTHKDDNESCMKCQQQTMTTINAIFGCKTKIITSVTKKNKSGKKYHTFLVWMSMTPKVTDLNEQFEHQNEESIPYNDMGVKISTPTGSLVIKPMETF